MMVICCANMKKILTVIILFSIINHILGENVHKRFEYKYSFKGPYLAQKNNQVPFWTYSGSAIASQDNFRITPSLRSQKGQAWGNQITDFEFWEVEVVFRVNGGRQGADGLALWFTQTRGIEGPVFGSSDQWTGLGIFFDSFDNDNKRNNPYVMGVVNDGTKTFNHDNDGIGQQLGGCIRDYRNKPFPIRVKIIYYKHSVTVLIQNGMSKEEKDYELCFTAENVHLPTNGYFGVTAATGGLADDHDVSKFLVYSYRNPEEMAELIYDKDVDKFNLEFEQYQEKTQKAKDDYIGLHPDSASRKYENEYETSEQKDLYQIFQGQGVIFDIVKELRSKLDGLIAQQETTYSVIRTLQAVGGGQVAVPQLPSGSTGGFTDSIRRHEVDSMFNNQRELLQSTKDIKSYVTDIHQKSQQLISRSQQPQGSAQPIGGQYDYHATLKEVNEGLNILKRDLGKTNQRLGASPAGVLTTCTSCVSTGLLVALMLVQILILLGYFMYRDAKEAKAKKFY